MSYTTQDSSRTKTGDRTTEQKLVKVLAILETRKRQLLEEAGNGGKGKEKSFLASWTGKQIHRQSGMVLTEFAVLFFWMYEITLRSAGYRQVDSRRPRCQDRVRYDF